MCLNLPPSSRKRVRDVASLLLHSRPRHWPGKSSRSHDGCMDGWMDGETHRDVKDGIISFPVGQCHRRRHPNRPAIAPSCTRVWTGLCCCPLQNLICDADGPCCLSVPLQACAFQKKCPTIFDLSERRSEKMEHGRRQKRFPLPPSELMLSAIFLPPDRPSEPEVDDTGGRPRGLPGTRVTRGEADVWAATSSGGGVGLVDGGSMGCGPCGCTDEGRGDAGCRRLPDGDLDDIPEDTTDALALLLLLLELLLEVKFAPPPLPPLLLLLLALGEADTFPWLLKSLLT